MDFSFVHEFSSVDVQLVGVVDKQMALLLNLHLSFLQEIDVGGLLALFVDCLIFLALVDGHVADDIF